MLTLYADDRFDSPWVLAVWAALEEKRVPFRVRAIDLHRGEQREAEYVANTLTAKVPAIKHGDVWLSESSAILEYLEEVFAPPEHRALLPRELVPRAAERQLLSWMRTDFMELRRCMPFEGIFTGDPPPERTPKAERDAEKLLRAVATRTGRRTDPTYADFELACMMRRLIHYGYDLSKHAAAVAYSDAIWNRPSIQAWVTIRRKTERE